MLDIKLVQGNSVELRFQVTDANGTYINFDTWDIAEIYWVVKESLDSTETVLEKRFSLDEIVLTDSFEGQFAIYLSATDLANLVGNYFHEAVIQTTSGDVYTIIKDAEMDAQAFIVRKSLTQDTL